MTLCYDTAATLAIRDRGQSFQNLKVMNHFETSSKNISNRVVININANAGLKKNSRIIINKNPIF